MRQWWIGTSPRRSRSQQARTFSVCRDSLRAVNEAASAAFSARARRHGLLPILDDALDRFAGFPGPGHHSNDDRGLTPLSENNGASDIADPKEHVALLAVYYAGAIDQPKSLEAARRRLRFSRPAFRLSPVRSDRSPHFSLTLRRS